MNKQDCYRIIKSRYITEKASVLEQLAEMESNKCVKACETPKYVFLVDSNANKTQIAQALEMMYSDIKVKSVNTIRIRPQVKRFRGRKGQLAGYKKAIVSLMPGQSIGESN